MHCPSFYMSHVVLLSYILSINPRTYRNADSKCTVYNSTNNVDIMLKIRSMFLFYFTFF